MKRFLTTSKKITEQVDGSPVPVGDEGARAGPARPSANYCPAPLVDSQAGDAASASGRLLTPGREYIIQLPQRQIVKERRASVTHIDLVHEEMEKKPIYERNLSSDKKRKITESSNEETKKWRCPIAFELKDTLDMITKKVEELERYVMLNTNTKKEIKEVSEKIKKQVKNLNRQSIKDWLLERRNRPVEAMTIDTEVQANPEMCHQEVQASIDQEDMQVGKETKEQGTQAEDGSEAVKQVTLDEIVGYEDYKNQGNRVWDEQDYKKTEIK